MPMFRALGTQLFSAIASFIGVYLSMLLLNKFILDYLIGDKYSNEILAFSSGAFLYLAINTILGDLKKPHSLFNILLEALAFMSGVYVLSNLI